MKSNLPDRPTFKAQEPTSPIRQFALNLVQQFEGQNQEPIGTAIWIAPCLLLTAKHNIDFMLKGASIDDLKQMEITSFGILAYQIFDGPKYNIWKVVKIFCSGESDLALLLVQLDMYTDSDVVGFRGSLSISAAQPKIGSKVAGFGFSKQEFGIEISKNSPNWRLDSVSQATTGIVKKVYKQRRDRGLYNFPCFEINAQIDPGMSGGPVFDENGILIGVLCGSLPPTETQEAVGYCCTLWPFLRILIDINPANEMATQLTPAIDLALRGVLSVNDLSQLDPRQFPGSQLPLR